MRLGRREILLSALLVLVAVVLSSTVDGQTPKRGGTLRVANTGEPPTLDYSATTVGVTSNIATAIFETPFAFDASWRPQPMLVESHAMSPNGLTHTFKLRRGVLFHNGKEMTSEDVVASLTRWGKVGSRGIVVFNQVEAVTAPDKYTVVMSLKEPFAPLLAFLALPSSAAAIMPKEIAEATPAGPVTQYVGTGPYRFVEWIPNRHIKLARWDKYVPRSEAASGYAGRRDPLVDEVIYYPVGNVATRIAGVQAGDYDIADAVSTDLYAELKGDARVVPDVHEPGSWLVFFFNKKAGIMANVKLRQAVMAALSDAADPAGHRGESRPLPADAQHLSEGHALVHGGRSALVQPGQRPEGEAAGGRGGVQGRADPLADDTAVRLEPQVQHGGDGPAQAGRIQRRSCRPTSGPASSSVAPSRKSGSCSPPSTASSRIRPSSTCSARPIPDGGRRLRRTSCSRS